MVYSRPACGILREEEGKFFVSLTAVHPLAAKLAFQPHFRPGNLDLGHAQGTGRFCLCQALTPAQIKQLALPLGQAFQHIL